MLSPSSLHRPVALLAAVALAAGAAGCGGSDEGGKDAGSDPYASTWNEVCTALSTAQTTLQSEGAAAQEKVASTSLSAKAKAMAEPTSKYADSMTAALERVKDLEAPGEFRAFQTKVRESAPGTISVLQGIQEPLRRGDLKAIQEVFGRIDQKSVFPGIPAELKQRATACKLF